MIRLDKPYMINNKKELLRDLKNLPFLEIETVTGGFLKKEFQYIIKVKDSRKLSKYFGFNWITQILLDRSNNKHYLCTDDGNLMNLKKIKNLEELMLLLNVVAHDNRHFKRFKCSCGQSFSSPNALGGHKSHCNGRQKR